MGNFILIFIFGFGHITYKDTNKWGNRYCPVYRSGIYTEIILIKKWFTLFFVPLIPYKKELKELCPICGNTPEITA